jgi:hypothetical protein
MNDSVPICCNRNKAMLMKKRIILNALTTTDLNEGIQCIQKEFRPLDLFHILLRYSFILKCIHELFFLINLHTIPDNDKAKTG